MLLENGGLKNLNIIVTNQIHHTFVKFLVASKDPDYINDLRVNLSKRGIQTEKSYKPLHLRSPFSMYSRTLLKETEQIWQGAFSIPVSPSFGLPEMHRVVEALKNYNLQ